MASSSTATKYWWLKDGNLGLGWLDTDSDGDTVLKAIEETNTVKVHYTRRPSDLSTTLSAKSELPAQFHEALVSRVLEKLFARTGEMDKARYWRAEWQDHIRDARKYWNKLKDGTGYGIRQYDY